MSREVRANLIFVVCLVILCAPGFVILMRRKLNGTSTATNAVPDAVHMTIGYVQPLPAPPMKRIEPGVARQWVTQLVTARAGASAASDLQNEPLGDPVQTDAFVTQFAALTYQSPNEPRISVIRWDESVNYANASKPTIDIDFAHAHVSFITDTAEPIDVPKDVRHALQDVGYVDPPAQVWWISAVGKTDAPVGPPQTLHLTTQTARGSTVVETMTFPPPVVATTEAAR